MEKKTAAKLERVKELLASGSTIAEACREAKLTRSVYSYHIVSNRPPARKKKQQLIRVDQLQATPTPSKRILALLLSIEDLPGIFKELS